MKTYIGIDPGAAGAIAIIMTDGNIHIWDEIPLDALNTISNQPNEYFVAIEKAQAMPGQGVVSMFHYGVNYGIWIGLLMAHHIPYQEIRPTIWKKEFSLIKTDKQASIEMAKKLFPSVADQLTRKKDHGRAEALLLAEYARRKNM